VEEGRGRRAGWLRVSSSYDAMSNSNLILSHSNVSTESCDDGVKYSELFDDVARLAGACRW
jgi:hypothetical protein